MDENKNDNNFKSDVNFTNDNTFKSVPTNNNSYNSFQPSAKREKTSGAGFGRTVVLPFCCGVLGAGIVIRWLYWYS